jgi:hypothetical protein
MQNRLPDLEEEDRRYNLHVGAEPIDDYNITLIWPQWTPPAENLDMAVMKPPAEIKSQLSKIGVIL